MESKHQAKQEVQESYAKYMKRIKNKKINSNSNGNSNSNSNDNGNGNSNVCFLCGRKGHYGSQTSCFAANRYDANQIRKGDIIIDELHS
jgi:hypothetical protein